MIAFVGSVFSSYYAWSGRGDPENHCAINLALYGPRSDSCVWTMTERGRRSLERTPETFCLGRSHLTLDTEGLKVFLDEVGAPWPKRVRGRIHLRPLVVNGRTFGLDVAGRHLWRPVAPLVEVKVEMETPAQAWSGLGYMDRNWGAEPLEAAFRSWSWSRAHEPGGSGRIHYDLIRRDGTRSFLALDIGRHGLAPVEDREPLNPLGRTFWGVTRAVRASPGSPLRVRTLEDTPFYTRSALSREGTTGPTRIIHESLDLTRLTSPLVRLMLPFRMPRAL